MRHASPEPPAVRGPLRRFLRIRQSIKSQKHPLARPPSEPYDLGELARALPAHWRRPARAADFATAPGRNCYLFAALCKLALGGSDEGVLTWGRTLNREFAVPLPDSEVRGTWRSVCRYRARWRVQGHQQGWLFRQAARGRRSGEARRAGTPLAGC